ncbi:46_t:CDS:2 [Entrophospora sp. SA101]|nr:46_t:CDS:2 [Entrophospora sp. SA101]
MGYTESETEDKEVIEDMEINFVQDKDVIDVPTARGKIKCLTITVDPGSKLYLCLGTLLNVSV